MVTFNTQQQTLIADLLDDERRRDPALECYFADSELEPVFVKNLENVQGDERDIIYFSTTFGPDRNGQLSMNFGPLNKDGGERRLNVAVTRARMEMRVFSSLKWEDISLTRTKARGVHDLRKFLEFASHGARALSSLHEGSVGAAESPFESQVAQALQGLGWEVRTQIGVSSFRVDLGVVDPEQPGRFLAGIECDGATYHRAATARDRDRLREQVLRGLGWQIVRIWSTDWWLDPHGVLQRTDQALRDLQQQRRQELALKQAQQEAAAMQGASATPAAQTNGAAQPDAGPAALDSASPQPESGQQPGRAALHSVAEPEPPAHAGSSGSIGEADTSSDTESERAKQPAAASRQYAYQAATRAPLSLAVWRDAKLPPCPGLDADSFFLPAMAATLCTLLREIGAGEGPLPEAALARRGARLLGWARTGARIRERVAQLARQVCDVGSEAGGVFYWSRGTLGQPQPFRRTLEPRALDEICEAELLSLAQAVLDAGYSGEAALNAMAREAGWQKLAANNRSRLQDVLRQAMAA